ncbi:MAG: beta galactosidase jelly roll domain-containing protein [Cyclobacteriaceae bacterium]
MKFILQSLLLLFVSMHTLDAQDMLLSLKGSWKFRLGDKMAWAEADFDDSNWDDIYAPSEWENEGFNGYDGYAWYRKTFDGELLKDRYNLELNLGYIDDADQVFFNGQLIGYSGTFPPNFTTAYNALRVYNIPQELVRDGENVISVRVFDTVLGGGIVAGRIGIYEERKAQYGAMTLEGLWKFSEGDNMVWKNAEFDDSDWAYLMVPGFWRYIGKKNFESYGWYRKSFRLPERLDDKELTIILGLIDDFDEVYLNGRLIGRTNDYRDFGHSQSYRKLRIYPVPDEVINYEGDNILSVRIKDLGGEAGIYKGPLVIVESRYAALFVRDHYDNY